MCKTCIFFLLLENEIASIITYPNKIYGKNAVLSLFNNFAPICQMYLFT